MNKYRVYAACLAAYNNGRLHGRWIDCASGADHIRAELAAMLRESPEPNVRVECPECGPQYNPCAAFNVRCDTCKGAGTVPSAEEWAFHDFEGFPGYLTNEHEDIDTLATYAETVDSLHDETEREAFAFWYDDQGSGSDDLEGDFRDAYMGTFDDELDWAHDYIESTGYLRDVPDIFARYFDYEAYARDAFYELDGHHGTYGFHVFSNN